MLDSLGQVASKPIAKMRTVGVPHRYNPQDQLDRVLDNGPESSIRANRIGALELLDLGQRTEARVVVVQIRGLGVEAHHVDLDLEERDLADSQA